MKENIDDSIFEVKNTEVNILEILREIESKLPKRDIDFKDIQRISELSHEKIQSKNLRFFDPAYTAHLFEKGIQPPKFTNPKLWFVRGPVKWFICKLIDLYSLFDKKISENRTKAFYNLVHEVMLIKQSHKTLEEKFHELLKDYLKLKTHITNNNSHLIDIKNFYLNPSYEKVENSIFEFIQKNQNKNILLLFPETFHLIRKLEISNISFLALTNQTSIYNFLRENYTQNVQFYENPLDIKDFFPFEAVVICKNLSEFPNWNIQTLFLEFEKKIQTKSKIYAWFKNSSVSSANPFQENFPTRIVLDSLSNYLNKIDFILLGYTIIEKEICILNIQKK